jgi:hypothetical protein
MDIGSYSGLGVVLVTWVTSGSVIIVGQETPAQSKSTVDFLGMAQMVFSGNPLSMPSLLYAVTQLHLLHPLSLVHCDPAPPPSLFHAVTQLHLLTFQLSHTVNHLSQPLHQGWMGNTAIPSIVSLMVCTLPASYVGWSSSDSFHDVTLMLLL